MASNNTVDESLARRASGFVLTEVLRLPATTSELIQLVCARGFGQHVRRVCRVYQNPVIIGGCGRSGTTLLMSVLSCHPEIHLIDGEHGWFSPGAYDAQPDYSAPIRTRPIIDHLMKENIARTNTHWCEKTPKNVHFFDQILNHFGTQCRLIHIVRDGRDVVTSRHPDKPGDYWVDKDRWVNDVRAGLSFQSHPQVLTIRYEDLVQDFDNMCERLCSFVGIHGASYLRRFPEGASSKTLERVTMDPATLDVHAASIGRWKDSAHNDVIHDFYMSSEAVGLLSSLGYEP